MIVGKNPENLICKRLAYHFYFRPCQEIIMIFQQLEICYFLPQIVSLNLFNLSIRYQ